MVFFFLFRFGRLSSIIGGVFAASVCGIVQSFSPNFELYLVMEFLTAAFAAMVLPSGIVISAEWVSSKNRVQSTTIVSFSVIIGESVMALTAMYFQNVRTFFLVYCTPGLFVFVYFWLVPESARWLYATGRVDKAEKTLKKSAAVNGKEIPQKTLDQMRAKYSAEQSIDVDNETKVSLASIFKSKPLLLRFIRTSICWIVNAFIYYGIGIMSTRIKGDDNKYLSFIIVSFMALPGSISALYLLTRFGRRKTLFAALTTSGISIILSSLVPDNYKTIILIFFLISKVAITCSFMSIYTFTTELWPTSQRQTMLGLCSMMGRIGGMLAPITILLSDILPALPNMLFGAAGILAALLILLNPETLGKKLPDTLEEAKDLSK